MRTLLSALRLIRMIGPKTLLFVKIQSKPQDGMLANKEEGAAVRKCVISALTRWEGMN